MLGVAVGILAAVSVGSGVMSLALFTSTTAVGANAFTTGTLVLSTSSSSALISFSGMAPGDKVTAPLTVSNTGTLQLRYAVTSATTGSSAFAGALTVDVKSGVGTCTNGGFAGSGTSVYSGALS